MKRRGLFFLQLGFTLLVCAFLIVPMILSIMAGLTVNYFVGIESGLTLRWVMEVWNGYRDTIFLSIGLALACLGATLALGIPAAYVLATGAALMYQMNMFDAQILAQNTLEGANSFPLLAVPFFMLAGEIMNVKLTDRTDGSGDTKTHPGRSSALVKRIPDQCWPAYFTKFPYTVSDMLQLQQSLSINANGNVSLEAGDSFAWRYDDAMLCVYNLNNGGGLTVTPQEAAWSIGYIQNKIPCCPGSYTAPYSSN